MTELNPRSFKSIKKAVKRVRSRGELLRLIHLKFREPARRRVREDRGSQETDAAPKKTPTEQKG